MKSAKAVAEEIGVTADSVNRYRRGARKHPSEEIAAKIDAAVRVRWQPQVRKCRRKQAAATGGITVETRARFGYTAPVGSTDDGRFRRLTVHLPPAYAQRLFDARDAGASDQEMRKIIAEGLLRVIDADITVTTTDGRHVQGRYRLLTTLLDHRVDPAEQLVRLYHERWEAEGAFHSLRHTLLTGRVLRSGDPVGVEQEMWALLATYQVLRIAMVAAIESAPGLDPDRASFTTALETARDLLTAGRGVVPAAGDSDLVGDIGRAVLSDLLPPRRLRTSIRKVKCPISRSPARPADNRPLTSQSIAITLYTAHDTPPPPQVRHRRSWSPAAHTPTPAPSRTSPTAGRQHRVLTILAAEPGRAWHGRELARMLCITNLNSFCVQLSQWSSEGIIRKTGRALYTLAGHASMPLTSADTA